jgi:hypothetical protein
MGSLSGPSGPSWQALCLVSLPAGHKLGEPAPPSESPELHEHIATANTTRTAFRAQDMIALPGALTGDASAIRTKRKGSE